VTSVSDSPSAGTAASHCLDDLDDHRLELLLRLTEADRSAEQERQRAAEQPGPAAGATLVLSHAQERIWLAEQLDPGHASYNVSLPLRLRGSLDHAALSAALNRIVARHDALRTTVTPVGGRPAGRLAQPTADVLQTIDLRALAARERDNAIRDLVTRHASTPFDLAAGPLFRMELIQATDEDHVLLLSVHHIAADNFSLRVFWRELEAYYPAVDPDTTDIGPVSSYAEYAARQRARIDADLPRLAQYWIKQLAGMSDELALPFDRPRPAQRTFHGAQVPFVVPANHADGLADLARRHAVTPFIVMITGLFVVLQRCCGQDDIAVGTDVANRGGPGLDDVIGFFANQLVIRMSLADNPTAADALARMKKTCSEAIRHQDLPFQHLVGLHGSKRDGSRSPLFQVKIGYLPFSLNNLSLPGLTVSTLPTEGTAKFDIEVTCWPTQHGTVDGRFEYATDLFDHTTIQRMSEYLTAAVAGICDDDGQRVLDIPLGDASRKSHTALTERFTFE
jgi:hypothetical protein